MTCAHTLGDGGTCFLCPPPAPQWTRAELEALQDQVKVEQSKRKLSAFLRHGWHVLEPSVQLEWAEHIDVLCDHIQAMLEDWASARDDQTFQQRCRNLAINVPPGTLKSRILSVYAPAWMWIAHPEWRLFALSSNPKVADRDAGWSRDVILSDWYQQSFKPTWSLRPDKDALRDFHNTSGGYRITRGMNSSVVGLRADAIFVDDPNDIKDVSDIKLEAVSTSWLAAQNRVNDPRIAIRVIIQQRTHERDLTGAIFQVPDDGAKGKAGWQHLAIPMEREINESTGESIDCVACHEPHGPTFLGWIDKRTAGEVLQPERNTPAVLKHERRALGPYGYAGQMQQRPAPIGGGMFKSSWWRSFDSLEMTRSGRPKLDRCVISVDATFKLEGTSRMCVGVVGARGPKRIVLDLWVGKADILGAYAAIEGMILKHPYYTKILIEDKANGSALITMLSKRYSNVVGCNPQGGKVSRANAIVPAVHAGDVILPRLAAWREDFVAECASFPNGRYDDQVDMLTQALIDMAEPSAVERARSMGSW